MEGGEAPAALIGQFGNCRFLHRPIMSEHPKLNGLVTKNRQYFRIVYLCLFEKNARFLTTHVCQVNLTWAEPCQVEAQGPTLSTKGSYVRFKSAVWKLPDHKSQTDYRNIILEIYLENVSYFTQGKSSQSQETSFALLGSFTGPRSG